MQIAEKTWSAFIRKLRKVNAAASQKILDYLKDHPIDTLEDRNALIDFAYAVATKYGEGAAALACEMYDAIAAASAAPVAAALPAATPTIGEVAKAITGTLKTGNETIVADSVGRLVKQTGVDTTMQNALRDGAEWAWIPSGDTCAFCITLASRGWQRASRAALKGGHAEHIHANCDCTYAIRFDSSTNVAGYDPDQYREMYENADPGGSPKDKINAMRREFYAENKDEINAQKRDNYEKRKELNSSAEEEVNVAKTSAGGPVQFDAKISDDPKYKGAVDLIGNLTNEYNSRLERVTVGAERAAGDVDVSGERMRLNSAQGTVVLHEFAHTLAGTAADKFGLTNDQDFWKDIRKIMRQYHKDVDATQDVNRWISTYEHSSRNVDEFMAEAFAHAKAKELGLEIPKKYGSDFTYSQQVLEAVNKYFKK